MLFKIIKYAFFIAAIFVIIVMLYLVLLFNSVITYERQFYIYNTINDSIISVYRHGDIGIVIAGYSENVPDTNYVKFINRLRFLDESLYVCWDVNTYKWKLIIDGTEIIDNKLDTTRFLFLNEFDRDDKGIPHVRAFVGDNCASMGFLGPHIIDDNIIVEAKWKRRLGYSRYVNN